MNSEYYFDIGNYGMWILAYGAIGIYYIQLLAYLESNG